MRITVVGDIMFHNSQLVKYYNSKTKSYNAEESFQWIRPKFVNSDLVMGNLETTIVNHAELYGGYPRFGSPKEVVFALKNSGFHILSTANNHSADKGSHGIDFTIDTVLDNEMIPLGTYKSEADFRNRRNFMMNKNGINIAIYNYTYSTNGIKVPKGKIVRLIEEESLEKDISFAKQNGANFVIVWFHFGTEYQTKPDAYQKKWVNRALELGADVVIGGHPHVVQKLERVGDKFFAYSLGNFLSAQNKPFTDGGLVLHFDLILSGNEKDITNILPEAVWVDPSNYQIIPIDDALEGKLEIKLSDSKMIRMKNYKKQYLNVISDIEESKK